jgi:hypothetical protein
MVMLIDEGDIMKCKNCGEEIFQSSGRWFHRNTDDSMCEPVTHAEPEAQEPKDNLTPEQRREALDSLIEARRNTPSCLHRSQIDSGRSYMPVLPQ